MFNHLSISVFIIQSLAIFKFHVTLIISVWFHCYFVLYLHHNLSLQNGAHSSCVLPFLLTRHIPDFSSILPLARLDDKLLFSHFSFIHTPCVLAHLADCLGACLQELVSKSFSASVAAQVCREAERWKTIFDFVTKPVKTFTFIYLFMNRFWKE